MNYVVNLMNVSVFLWTIHVSRSINFRNNCYINFNIYKCVEKLDQHVEDQFVNNLLNADLFECSLIWMDLHSLIKLLICCI